MKLLLLGGPRFLGRAIADAALDRGHELTFFNRGRTSPELYPEVEKLHGERAADLGPLDGRTWDAVVDTCGYLPGVVRASALALAGSGRYCFVSSISVYADFRGRNDESSAVAELRDLPRDEVTNESYGPLKALCEDAVRDAFGGRALVVRPGLIVGPHDPTGRFTYWPHRVARGGARTRPTESQDSGRRATSRSGRSRSWNARSRARSTRRIRASASQGSSGPAATSRKATRRSRG